MCDLEEFGKNIYEIKPYGVFNINTHLYDTYFYYFDEISSERSKRYTDFKYNRQIWDCPNCIKIDEQHYLYDNMTDELTDEIYSSSTVLYNIVPIVYLQVMLVTGLFPRYQYKDKVYLLKDDTDETLEKYARFFNRLHRTNYRDFAVFQINLKDECLYDKTDKFTQYRFFKDSDTQYIFTYENIEPVYISKINKEIHIEINETNKSTSKQSNILYNTSID